MKGVAKSEVERKLPSQRYVLLSLCQTNFQFNFTRFEDIDTVEEETKQSCEDRCNVVIKAAFALEDIGDLIGAVAALRQALAICPSYPYVRRALGDMLFRLQWTNLKVIIMMMMKWKKGFLSP
jgi:hypothetical protein